LIIYYGIIFSFQINVCYQVRFLSYQTVRFCLPRITSHQKFSMICCKLLMIRIFTLAVCWEDSMILNNMLAQNFLLFLLILCVSAS
jgi:hypothetical protein